MKSWSLTSARTRSPDTWQRPRNRARLHRRPLLLRRQRRHRQHLRQTSPKTAITQSLEKPCCVFVERTHSASVIPLDFAGLPAGNLGGLFEFFQRLCHFAKAFIHKRENSSSVKTSRTILAAGRNIGQNLNSLFNFSHGPDVEFPRGHRVQHVWPVGKIEQGIEIL